MLHDIVTQILNMIIFCSSPRNQLPNHGLRAGDKYYWKPATSTSNSSSVPQVTRPFPSHPIFGMAHPPGFPQYGPFYEQNNNFVLLLRIFFHFNGFSSPFSLGNYWRLKKCAHYFFLKIKLFSKPRFRVYFIQCLRTVRLYLSLPGPAQPPPPPRPPHLHCFQS